MDTGGVLERGAADFEKTLFYITIGPGNHFYYFSNGHNCPYKIIITRSFVILLIILPEQEGILI